MALPETWTDSPQTQHGALLRPDGQAVQFTMMATPLGGAAQGEQLLTLLRDGDQERLGELLLHVQRLTGIGTLTASVAHELTSPISILSAALANIKDEMITGDLTPEQLGRYVEMMEQSVGRAARIVEILRQYTHNEGGLSMAVTSAEDLVRDALMMVEQQFRKNAHVEVETEIEASLGTILADHNRLTQVLINLLTNARDAVQPGGGTIHVQFWPLSQPPDDLLGRKGTGGNGQRPRDYFAFSVSDAGHGLAPEIFDRLFEPFFTTKPGGMGTGLGLFISKEIVEQHHGRMWAQNNPDGGATFMVVLPKRPVT